MDRGSMQNNIDAFRALAHQRGWTINSERELDYKAYQLRITNGVATVPIDFFRTGTVLIQGNPSELRNSLKAWWAEQKTQQSPPPLWDADTLPPTEVLPGPTIPTTPKPIEVIPRIGSDEMGKEDYFGPLVVAAVYIDEQTEAKLIDLKVRDSKLLPDNIILAQAEEIKEVCRGQGTVLSFHPERYNELCKATPQMSQLLTRAYAQVIATVQKRVQCKLAIAGHFGDETLVRNILAKEGCTISIKQQSGAEDDIAIATASIIARAEFIHQIVELSQIAGVDLPKGTSNPGIISTGREIVKKHGQSMLAKVAKLHFATTQEILSGM